MNESFCALIFCLARIMLFKDIHDDTQILVLRDKQGRVSVFLLGAGVGAFFQKNLNRFAMFLSHRQMQGRHPASIFFNLRVRLEIQQRGHGGRLPRIRRQMKGGSPLFIAQIDRRPFFDQKGNHLIRSQITGKM